MTLKSIAWEELRMAFVSRWIRERGICCSIARSLDVVNVRRELGDVVQMSDLPGGEAV